MRLREIYISESRCELGEGLAGGSNGLVAWVDINRDIIFVQNKGCERRYSLKSKATVIFRIMEDTLEFGSKEGVFQLDLCNGVETLLINPPSQAKTSLRSNDGCYAGKGKYFLGFMHQSNPEVESGQVFCFDGENWHLIDNEISIPNTFLNVGSNKLLISDSLHGVIWEYVFGKDSQLLAKNIWVEFSQGVPDGGVIFDQFAFIAIWDLGCVARINLDTKERYDYKVPVIRPTNCFVDIMGTKLWISSAYQGLTQKQLTDSPLSGATLAFEISL